LIGFLEFSDERPGDIWLVPWRYFNSFLECYNFCPGDIWLVCWRYL